MPVIDWVNRNDVIDAHHALHILGNTLSAVDERLIAHGERVALLLHLMLRDRDCFTADERSDLYKAAILHDIGAYKTEEIDRLTRFESNNIWEHSIYGYLFLRTMLPTADYSDALLFHHLDYNQLGGVACQHKDFATLICLADRVDVFLLQTGHLLSASQLRHYAGTRFDPKWVELLIETADRYPLADLLHGNGNSPLLEEVHENIRCSPQELQDLLRMIALTVDFRSAYTVNHTIMTVAISYQIARLFALDDHTCADIFYGALLHDIGKVAIPVSILEKPGRLTEEETIVMQNHIVVTEYILSGNISPEILKISARHHEKLDGSGYPRGLTGDVLTLPQRIVAIADIVSALRQRRSYKEPFSQEQILSILRDYIANGKICPVVGQRVITCFDAILTESDRVSQDAQHAYDNIAVRYRDLFQLFQPLMHQQLPRT